MMWPFRKKRVNKEPSWKERQERLRSKLLAALEVQRQAWWHVQCLAKDAETEYSINGRSERFVKVYEDMRESKRKAELLGPPGHPVLDEA